MSHHIFAYLFKLKSNQTLCKSVYSLIFTINADNLNSLQLRHWSKPMVFYTNMICSWRHDCTFTVDQFFCPNITFPCLWDLGHIFKSESICFPSSNNNLRDDTNSLVPWDRAMHYASSIDKAIPDFIFELHKTSAFQNVRSTLVLIVTPTRSVLPSVAYNPIKYTSAYIYIITF